jgi:hypothetical protein
MVGIIGLLYGHSRSIRRAYWPQWRKAEQLRMATRRARPKGLGGLHIEHSSNLIGWELYTRAK